MVIDGVGGVDGSGGGGGSGVSGVSGDGRRGSWSSRCIGYDITMEVAFFFFDTQKKKINVKFGKMKAFYLI